MSPTADELNAKMVALCPELSSRFATYPLKGKEWLSPKAQVNQKHYAFTISPKNQGPRPHYVYGKGPYGPGYYHLLTRQAYTALYQRLTQELRPTTKTCSCLCSTAEDRKAYEDWDDVKSICYNRSVATIPDDEQARKDAMEVARGVAISHYHEQEDFKLLVNSLGTATVDKQQKEKWGDEEEER